MAVAAVLFLRPCACLPLGANRIALNATKQAPAPQASKILGREVVAPLDAPPSTPL
jgi:hypothetical protein